MLGAEHVSNPEFNLIFLVNPHFIYDWVFRYDFYNATIWEKDWEDPGFGPPRERIMTDVHQASVLSRPEACLAGGMPHVMQRSWYQTTLCRSTSPMRVGMTTTHRWR